MKIIISKFEELFQPGVLPEVNRQQHQELGDGAGVGKWNLGRKKHNNHKKYKEFWE
jgi:hypothetical protein